MTRPASPFRKEALDFRTGQYLSDQQLKVDARWTVWLYWAVLLLTVAGVVALLVIRTDETTSGPARVDLGGRTFVALVPHLPAEDVGSGTSVLLELPGLPDGHLDGRVEQAEVADEASAREAGFSAPGRPTMLVSGVVEAQPGAVADVAGGPLLEGRAVVVLRSGTVLDVLSRHGSTMFGGP